MWCINTISTLYLGLYTNWFWICLIIYQSYNQDVPHTTSIAYKWNLPHYSTILRQAAVEIQRSRALLGAISHAKWYLKFKCAKIIQYKVSSAFRSATVLPKLWICQLNQVLLNFNMISRFFRPHCLSFATKKLSWYSFD